MPLPPLPLGRDDAGLRGARAAWTPTLGVRASIALHAAALGGSVAAPGAWPWLLGALAANHVALGAAGMWPRSTALGLNIVRLPPACATRGEVALTFDDGPDPEATPAILDLLDAHGAHASFFCVGARAEAHPGLVAEIVRRGHSVENHTATHPGAFACLLPGPTTEQVNRAQATLSALSGRPPRFFRAPMGLRSPFLDPVLARAGLRLVTWTRRGYDATCDDAALVLRRLGRGLAARDILVLHDGRMTRAHARGGRSVRPVALEILPPLLAAIADAGLRSVSLPDAICIEPSA